MKNSLRAIAPALAVLALLLPALEASHAETPVGSTGAAIGSRTMWTTGPSSLRTGPGFEYESAGRLEAGERVRVTGAVGRWLRIEAPSGLTAFIDSQDLMEIDPAAAHRSETESAYRTIRFANGDRYEGEVTGGRLHGLGTYTWADGDRYEGEWRDGRRHGRGAYFWADGNVYEGGWRNGRRHGPGTYTWADGDLMEGEWLDGRRQLPEADCLTVEKITRWMALWINRCEVGIDVIWRDQGDCRSRATDKWPCSWHIAPYGSEKAAITGQVWWRECKSPGGPGDVAAVEKENGDVYCVERTGPLTTARKTWKRERAQRNAQAAAERRASGIDGAPGGDSIPAGPDVGGSRNDVEGRAG